MLYYERGASRRDLLAVEYPVAGVKLKKKKKNRTDDEEEEDLNRLNAARGRGNAARGAYVIRTRPSRKPVVNVPQNLGAQCTV